MIALICYVLFKKVLDTALARFRKHIDTIRRRLLEAQRDAALGVVSKDFVDQYIDKIFVTPEPNGAIRLDIRIYTGDTTARYLDKLAARMEQMEASTTQGEDEETITIVCAVDIRAGQMNKKMIESYENGMH